MDAQQLEGVAMVVIAFFAGLTLLVPVLAFAARFALKPLAETMMKLKQSQTSDEEKIIQDRRIALLEAELQNMQQLLQHRIDAEHFDRALTNPKRESI